MFGSLSIGSSSTTTYSAPATGASTETAGSIASSTSSSAGSIFTA